jgi:hypothetical protein
MPAPIVSHRLAAAAVACVLLILAACTGRGEDAGPPPYEKEPFETTELCEAYTDAVPAGYFQDDLELEMQGWGASCDVRQWADEAYRNLGFNVYWSLWSDWPEATTENFTEYTQGDSIPIEGLGEAAAFVSKYGPGRDGLYLFIREGNLVIEFQAFSGNEVEGLGVRTVPLDTSANALVATAEWFLAELDAEPREVRPPEPDLDPGMNSLPELCELLDLDGLELAADQADWADDSETMDRCHWTGGDADLRLVAEAVAPLEAAGMPAEDFAAWWIAGTRAAASESVAVGDEAYVVDLDPEADEYDDVETPAADFAIRIGNVVLQGRYAADPGHSEVDAALLQQVMEQIGSQTEELLHGA